MKCNVSFDTNREHVVVRSVFQMGLFVYDIKKKG